MAMEPPDRSMQADEATSFHELESISHRVRRRCDDFPLVDMEHKVKVIVHVQVIFFHDAPNWDGEWHKEVPQLGHGDPTLPSFFQLCECNKVMIRCLVRQVQTAIDEVVVAEGKGQLLTGFFASRPKGPVPRGPVFALQKHRITHGIVRGFFDCGFSLDFQ
eukprot:CAMPEP_0196579576 /NCGR_PEP_ID=MMETSP1081-20130531/23034_1 /TAXON_ID=36882 /ORGANISM="Pyramimonas amylifera, Strain CCMP720" /LENGTH=160 /DNA_ID=CAMNT_0041899205 /DNA_START=321 /DNA_END=803 /DNA_ORIENTATION=+